MLNEKSKLVGLFLTTLLITVGVVVLLFVLITPQISKQIRNQAEESLQKLVAIPQNLWCQYQANQEAKRIIKQAITQNTISLDLSSLRCLTKLPPEIGQLTQLQWLYITNSQLAILPPEIGQLTQLQQLHVTGTQLTILPPEIGQLSQLRWLSVGYKSTNHLTA